MDIKSSIDLKTSRYTEYNLLGNNKYDYARYGILNKCLPKILFNTYLLILKSDIFIINMIRSLFFTYML